MGLILYTVFYLINNFFFFNQFESRVDRIYEFLSNPRIPLIYKWIFANRIIPKIEK